MMNIISKIIKVIENIVKLSNEYDMDIEVNIPDEEELRELEEEDLEDILDELEEELENMKSKVEESEINDGMQDMIDYWNKE